METTSYLPILHYQDPFLQYLVIMQSLNGINIYLTFCVVQILILLINNLSEGPKKVSSKSIKFGSLGELKGRFKYNCHYHLLMVQVAISR